MNDPGIQPRHLGAFACVVLLVVTAGCGTFASGGDADPVADRGTYDVAEDYDPPELLPGLTGAEVTDRIALRNAHFDALENRSYRAVYEITVRNGSGTIVSYQRRKTTVDGDRAEILTELGIDAAAPGGASTAHAWVDGDTEYLRQVNETGGVSYYPEVYTGTDPSLPISLLNLYDAVEAVSVERHDGTEYYRLEGQGDLPTYRNVTVDILLTEEGYIERYHVEVEYGRVGESLRAEHSGGFEPDDGIDLEEPEWIDEARERAGTPAGPGANHWSGAVGGPGINYWPEVVGGPAAEVRVGDSPDDAPSLAR